MTTDSQRLQGAHGPADSAGATPVARFLFFGRVIDTLGQGASFRRYFSLFLKIAAGGIAFAGLVALFNAWNFTARQEASGIFGGILYMLFLVAGTYMAVHAMILRAGQIATLPDGRFTLIPLCAVLALLVGEAYAAFSAAVSLGGGLLIWCARSHAYTLIRDLAPFVPEAGGSDFLAGLLFMIRGLIRAALALTAGYLASELLLVIGGVGERQAEGRSGQA